MNTHSTRILVAQPVPMIWDQRGQGWFSDAFKKVESAGKDVYNVGKQASRYVRPIRRGLGSVVNSPLTKVGAAALGPEAVEGYMSVQGTVNKANAYADAVGLGRKRKHKGGKKGKGRKCKK